MKRTRAQQSMGAILAALAPPKRAQPKYVGWFTPNSGALTDTFRNVVKSGKRIGMAVGVNGTVKFYAEDPEVPTYEYACSSCGNRTRLNQRIEERNNGPLCTEHRVGYGSCGARMTLLISPVAGIVKNPAVPRSK